MRSLWPRPHLLLRHLHLRHPRFWAICKHSRLQSTGLPHQPPPGPRVTVRCSTPRQYQRSPEQLQQTKLWT